MHIWLTSALGWVCFQFSHPSTHKKRSYLQKQQNKWRVTAKSSPPYKTHAHTHIEAANKSHSPETLISAFLPLCARAWEREARARRRKPAPANNRRKPVIRVEALRMIPGSGGRKTAWETLRERLAQDWDVTKLDETWRKSSRDLRRALDEASCQMKR